MHENTNGKPALGPNPNWAKTVAAEIDADVLRAIKAGHKFTRTIAQHLGISMTNVRVVDNALRRLKTPGMIHFLGAREEQGWRTGPAPEAPSGAAFTTSAKAPRKPKVARKVVQSTRAPKKAARSGRSNVHCFLPTSLVRHVKRQLEDGETFTDAVQSGLTKKYGSP